MEKKYCLTLKELEQTIVRCTLCPRLVEYRENVPEKAAFRGEKYWRKPVPGFGDPHAFLFIFGLAPAADGGNRTGRIFTGDKTAAFLMNALHKTGFANKPYSVSKEDGLILKGCYLTAAVKCAPPQNRPLPLEFRNCSRYFENELFLLKDLKSILLLGKSAFDAYTAFLKREKILTPPYPKFSHGAIYSIPGWPTMYTSYHPSPQNTNTNVLTEKMFISVLEKIKSDVLIDN